MDMCLAEIRRVVACGGEMLREGRVPHRQGIGRPRAFVAVDPGPLGRAAGQQTCARRHAGRRVAVMPREPRAARRQPVDGRRRHHRSHSGSEGAALAAERRGAELVSEDPEDVLRTHQDAPSLLRVLVHIGGQRFSGVNPSGARMAVGDGYSAAPAAGSVPAAASPPSMPKRAATSGA